ncbi:oligosaccharide flippase family protein [Aliiglaciecola lipolytica]|uniref:oligosaccharide flippase family protein n=1 Tax=Aliiglaciecola lipolytica TaxID=477689 RepID=UPI001C091FCB|nr:oligosaccharide flippase family protein [Aliiglaciecola lipolytica]MBU2877828.1 oligosaccharide flippase family protein [Aliiglaciecola lipolytica]
MKILKNAKYLYMALLMSQGLRFFYMLILARMLGAELYGLFSYGQSWYLMFLPLTGLGLGAMLSREVGKNRKNVKSIVDLVASIRIAAVCIVAILSMTLGIIYADNQFIASLLVIFSVALIGKGMVLWANQMFQAFEATYLIFKIERIFKPSEILVSISVAILTENILLIAAVHAVGQVIQGLVSIHLVNSNLKKVTLVFVPRKMITTVIKLLPLAVAVVAGQFLFHGSVVQAKNLFTTSEQLGNFSLLMQLFIVLLTIFSSVSNAALPALSRSAENNQNNLKLYSRIALYVASVFGIFAYIAASLIGQQLIVFIFTEKFMLASESFAFIMLTLIPAIIVNLLNSVQISLGHNIRVLVCNTSGALLLVSSMPYCIQHFGFQGAPISLCLSFSFSASIGVLFLLRERIIAIRDAVAVPILIATLFTITEWLSSIFDGENISLLVGGGLVILALWYVALQKQERVLFKSKIGSLLKR